MGIREAANQDINRKKLAECKRGHIQGHSTRETKPLFPSMEMFLLFRQIKIIGKQTE